MATKIKHTLIPLIVLFFLLSVSQRTIANQAASQTTFLPIVNRIPAGWIGPSGGTVVPVLFDPNNPQVVYAGSFGSGVYKSLDGGYSWQPSSQGLANLYINSLAIDPQQSSTLLAGTYKNQVYKTEDGGMTWFWSGTGMQDGAIVYSIAIDQSDPTKIYAATRGISSNGNPPWRGVLYLSNDGGSTWQPSLENLGGLNAQDWVYSVTVNPHNHNEVYIASHENGPFRSTDNGNHWQALESGITDLSGRAIVISTQAVYPITCYYGVWHADTVFKSTDGCLDWMSANNGISYEHVYSISIDPLNLNNVFLATFQSGILKTTDGGKTWQSGGLPGKEIYSVAIDPFHSSHMLAGTAGDGIYRTYDGGSTWHTSSNGVDNAMVTSVVISPVDPNISYASVYGGGVWQHDIRTNVWDEMNSGLTDRFVWDLVMDPSHIGWLYALTNQGGLFKNDLNLGNGWSPVGGGLPQTTHILPPVYPSDSPLATLDMQEASASQPEVATVQPAVAVPLIKMAFSPSNPQIAYLATGGSGVYYSNTGGQSWQVTGLNSGSIVDLAVDFQNQNIVFASTGVANGVLLSVDGGKSWNNTGLASICYSLTVSPVETGVVYAGTNNGIYRFQSGTWTLVGLSGQVVTAIQLDSAQPGRVYAGTDQGGYYSLDGGQTWAIASDYLTGQTIDAITVDPGAPSRVYYSTKTHGVYLFSIQ